VGHYYFAARDASYTYQRFLQAVAKFPAVCDDYGDGRNADAICRHSLATMFAHFGQETGDHNASSPLPQWAPGLEVFARAGLRRDGRRLRLQHRVRRPCLQQSMDLRQERRWQLQEVLWTRRQATVVQLQLRAVFASHA